MKKVIVTSMGFLNGSRVRTGQVIEVPDDFSASWVKPMDGSAEPAQKAEKKSRKTPETLSEMTKAKADTFSDVQTVEA
jgi:hypothetical protein